MQEITPPNALIGSLAKAFLNDFRFDLFIDTLNIKKMLKYVVEELKGTKR